MEIFANDQLVQVFLHRLLNDEHVHGVPFDVLPAEISLTFNTEQQNVEATAEMVAFCTVMQCDTERHSVSVLHAHRSRCGDADFR